MLHRLVFAPCRWSLSNAALAEHMQKVGSVSYAEIATGPDGRSKGWAIVEFASPAGEYVYEYICVHGSIRCQLA